MPGSEISTRFFLKNAELSGGEKSKYIRSQLNWISALKLNVEILLPGMESKKKIYLGLGIMAVAFLLACFLLVPFLIKQIKAASQDLIIQQQEFEKSQKEQQNIFHWKRQYQSSKQEIEKVADSFLSQEKLLDFVLALENIAQKSGNRCEIYVAEQKTKELVISDKEGEKKEN